LNSSILRGRSAQTIAFYASTFAITAIYCLSLIVF
jgi:hypothetical protein